ncbi:hypothetical protein GCM10020366_07500 [Saccharopolyspora gregorii]|uniref:Uncharacterized protein n=1 Tax=Saccharopolyspora gregorii TaxID=33914 RepID=A0ABP6RHR2_9PSEU
MPAAGSLLLMPGLSYPQRRAGRALRSATAVADSEAALRCTYLSGVLLAVRLRLVLGRSGGRAGDRGRDRAGGPAGLAGRALLLITARPSPRRAAVFAAG